MFRNLSLLIVLILYNTVKSGFITTTGPPDVRVFVLNQEHFTDYTFNVEIPTSINNNAMIEVDFPYGYQLTANCESYIRYSTNWYSLYPCTKTGPYTFLIDVGYLPASNYSIVVTGVQNPPSVPASSTFMLKTSVGGLVPVDNNEHIPGVPFFSPIGTNLSYFLLNSLGVSYNMTITNTGYTSVNLGSEITFNFSLHEALIPGDSIKFNFPSGFYFVKPICFHHNSGLYAPGETLYNNRMVLCSGFQTNMEINVWQQVTVFGILNPGYAGNYQFFTIETLRGPTPQGLEYITAPAPLAITPGNIEVSILSSSILRICNTTHQLNIIPDDDIPGTAILWIKLPAGFTYLSPNCTLLKPLTAAPGNNISCGVASDNSGYIIQGFSDIAAKQLVSVLLSVQNPGNSETYVLHVYSYSTIKKAKIDEAFPTIWIETRFGSDRYFKSHSLVFTPSVQHSQTGALEFTFFLTIPLPSTQSTFYGKVLVDIKPQIPTPTGTVVCFFYSNVPAQSCTWDNSNSEQTQITIYTPVTEIYYRTDIPITVTTEIPSGFYGITLPQLVQRYKFYFYFWRNGDTKEHEVYYQDYIPNAETMDSTWVQYEFNPAQYNQYSYLTVTWTNKYMNLANKNYYFEFQFPNNNNAWNYQLGFTTANWYDFFNYPCIVTGLGSNYQCVLRPGFPATTGTTSLIQVFNITAMPLGTVATFHFPKILFGSSGTPTFNVYLMQNTPGQSTNFIPILSSSFSFTPTSSSVSASGYTTLSASPNAPDVSSTLSWAWTAATSNPQVVIYEIPTSFTGLTTKSYSCASGTCYVFAGSVNWMVYVPSGSIGTAISNTEAVKTPLWSQSMTMVSMSVLNSAIVDKKSSTLTINPGVLTSVSWTVDSTLNSEVNKNSLVYFDLSFTTATALPKDNSIMITFTNLEVPDSYTLFCQITTTSTLLELDTRGIICTQNTTSIIRIYNLEAIPAGSSLGFIFGLTTTTATAVTASVVTYYDRLSSKIVDETSSPFSLTLSFLYINFASSAVLNDYSGNIVRASGSGVFTFTLKPQSTYSSSNLEITFPVGFSSASGTSNDVLMCKAAGVRKFCTYTYSSQLVITIPKLGSAQLSGGTACTFSVSTEYQYPGLKGIKAPSTPGIYEIVISIYTGGTLKEQINDYLYVYPTPIPSFQVSAATLSAGLPTMYTFTFSLSANLNAYSDTTQYGRVWIDFPTGTNGFADDLGTGLQNGEFVGCNIQGITVTNYSCNLFTSPGNGIPASIMIAGLPAITAPSATITLYVANIKNPTTYIGEFVFALRTEEVTVTTSAILPIEYGQYSYWLPLVTSTVLAGPYTGPTPTLSGTPGVAGGQILIDMYTEVSLVSGDYYIYQIPTSFTLPQTLTCPSKVSLCIPFPSIGWVVYKLNSAVPSVSNTETGNINSVTLPASLNPSGYTITGLIWHNQETSHQVTFTTGSTASSAGTLTSISIIFLTGQNVLGRTNTEVEVDFTTASAIPKTGSILITFPTAANIHPNCKNIPTTNLATTSTGTIACEIQSGGWYIKNFNAIPAGSSIKFIGLVDVQTSGTTFSATINTYGNQATSLATNGELIDTGSASTTLAGTTTLILDASPTFSVNQEFTQSALSTYAPIIFDVTLSSTVTSTTPLSIQLHSTLFSSTLYTGAQLSCYFLSLSSYAYIPCSVSVCSSCTNLEFNLFTLTGILSSGSSYRSVITSVFANSGKDGVQQKFTSVTSDYAIVTTGSYASVNFFEIFPTSFTSITVKNYVIAPNSPDVIDIAITANIPTTARLVIELPTYFNSTALFAADLGMGYTNLETNLVELLSSSGGTSFNSYFQMGNPTSQDPARFVLSGFNAAITALRIAFVVKNPSVSTSTVIPIKVYTVSDSPSAFTKGYFQYVEQAIVVVSSSPSSISTSTAPTYSPTTISTSSTLTVPVYFTTALNAYDAYVIQIPKSSVAATAGIQSISPTNMGTVSALYLPKNSFIVLIPQGSTTAGSTTAAVTVKTSDLVLPSTSMAFNAYASYYSTMTCVQTTYSTNAAQFTNSGSSFTPTVTASNFYPYNQNILTFTMSSSLYSTGKFVMINLPSQVTVGADCYEGKTNNVFILSCTTYATNNEVYITLDGNTANTNLEVNVLVTNSGPATLGAISYVIYSVVKTTPVSDLNSAIMSSSVTPSPGIVISGSGTQIPSLFQISYVPYIEYIEYYPTGTYGNLKLQFTPNIALPSGYKIKILPSSTGYFKVPTTPTLLGDFTSILPAVYLSIGGALPYSLLTATTDASFTNFEFTLPSAVSSGTTLTIIITDITTSSDNRGLYLASVNPVKMTFTVDVLDTTNTLKYTGTTPALYIDGQSPVVQGTLSYYMTQAASTANVYVFTLTSNSGNPTIDTIYLEFPHIDQYGNTIFASNMGSFSNYESVPCAVVQSSTAQNAECFAVLGSGTHDDPPKVVIQGISFVSGTMTVYLYGPKNPSATSTVTYFYARCFHSGNIVASPKITGYTTLAAGTISTVGYTSGTLSTTVNKVYGNTGTFTYTFPTASSVSIQSVQLVQLMSSSCYANNLASSNQFVMYGTTSSGNRETYVIQTGSVSASSTYSFNNIECTGATNGFSFKLYQFYGSNNGEIKTSQTDMSRASIISFLTAGSLTATFTTGDPISGSGLIGKLQIAGMNALTIASGSALEIDISMTAISSVTSCMVTAGLVPIGNENPQCTLGSSNLELKITGFSALTSSNTVNLLLTFQNSGGAYSGGTITVYSYGSSTLYSSQPYSSAATSSITYSNSGHNPSITIGSAASASYSLSPSPLQGESSVTYTLTFSTSSFSSSYTVASGDNLEVCFDSSVSVGSCTYTPNAYTSCTVSSQCLVLPFATTGSISSLPSDSLQVVLSWPSVPGNFFTSVSIWSSGTIQAITLGMYITLGSQSYTMSPSPVAFSVLHLSQSLPNEFQFYFSAPVTLDTTQNMIMSSVFSSNIMMSGVTSYSQIDCYCTSTATCYYYSVSSTYAIDFVFSSLSSGSGVYCYVPNTETTATSVTAYFQFINLYNREVYYKDSTGQTVSSFASYSGSGLTLSVAPTSPPAIAGTTGSVAATATYSGSYTGGYIYLDMRNSGPTSSPCTGGYTSCRFYNTVRNILVNSLSSSFSSGSQVFSVSNTFASTVSDQTANYTAFGVMVGNSQNAEYYTGGSPFVGSVSNYEGASTTSPSFTPSITVPGFYSYSTITLSTASFAIPSSTSSGVGGMIKILLTGYSSISTGCYGYFSSTTLTCEISGSGTSWTLYATSPINIPASTTVTFYIQGTNPSSVTTQAFIYQYYDSSTATTRALSLQSSSSAYTFSGTSLNFETTAFTVFPFITRSISTTTAPIIFNIKSPYQIVANTESITLTYASGQASLASSPTCIIRQVINNIDFTQIGTGSCTGTTGPETITCTPSVTLSANQEYQIVIQDNYPIITAASATYTASFTASTNIATYQGNVYKYISTPYVKLYEAMVTSLKSANPNTLILTLQASTTIPAYAGAYIQINFPSASSTVLKSGLTNRYLPCGMKSVNNRTNSNYFPRCTLVQTSVPFIRIENYNAISSGTFTIALYDLDNTIIPQSYGYLDLDIVTNYQGTGYSIHHIEKLFQVVTGSAAPASSSATFPTVSTNKYATSSNMVVTISLPTSCSASNCRLVIEFPGSGYAFLEGTATLKLGSSYTSQTNVLVDQANNAMVMWAPTGAPFASGSFNIEFASVYTPLPQYNTAGTLYIEYSQGLNVEETYTFTGSAPTLTGDSLTAMSGTCTSPLSQKVGKNDYVECTVTFTLNNRFTAVSAINVETTTGGSQWSSFLPYCQATASASGIVTYGQLLCGRLDTSSTTAIFLISGFSYNSADSISWKFRAKAMTSTTISGNYYLQTMVNGQYYTLGSQTWSVSLTGGLSTSLTGFSSFTFYSNPPQSLGINSVSPLRVLAQSYSTLSAGNTITLAPKTASTYNLPSGTNPLCTLRPVTTYGLPILGACTFNSGTNTYTITLLDTISSSRFLIEIQAQQYYPPSAGVTFPSTTAPVFLQVSLGGNSDNMGIYPTPAAYNTMKVSQLNQIAGYNSEIIITFDPSVTVGSDSAPLTAENILVIDFPKGIYLYDLGASTVGFAADNLPYYDGMIMPATLSLANAYSAIRYGTSSGSDDPLIVVRNHGGISSTTTLSISYIANPALYSRQGIRIYIANYPSGQTYPTILQDVTYIDWGTPIAPGTEGTPTLTLTPSTTVAFTTVSFTMTKNYGVALTSSDRVWMKLLNKANGLGLTALSLPMTCTGFQNTEYLASAYMFYLTPQASGLSSPFTTTCSANFENLETGDIVTIETGIFKAGHSTTQYSQSSYTISVLTPVTAETRAITRVSGNSNPNSINYYLLQYYPGTISIPQGSKLLILIPAGLKPIPGRTEQIIYTGLQSSSTRAVGATIVGNNLEITGFANYYGPTSGTINIEMLLQNVATGNWNFEVEIISSSGTVIAKSALFPNLAISVPPSYSDSVTFNSYLTDAAYVPAGSIYPLKITVTPTTSVTYATTGQFQITLPSGWSFSATPELCKYSINGGANWIRSTTFTVSGQVVTFNIQSGFDVTSGTSVILQLTTDNFTPTPGITRATTPTMYTFQVSTKTSGSIINSAYDPLILLPAQPSSAPTIKWLTQGSNDMSIITLSFTASENYLATDIYNFELVTNNELTTQWTDNLGQTSVDFKMLGNCVEPNGNTVISSTQVLGCYLTQGESTWSPPVPAQLTVRATSAVSSGTANVGFYAANIENPGTNGEFSGYIFSVQRKCRNDGFTCPIYYYPYYIKISTSHPSSSTTGSVSVSSSSNLNNTGYYDFVFNSVALSSTDAIVIRTPTQNVEITATCSLSSMSGTCVHFPAIGWTLIQPSTSVGTSYNFKIYINTGFYIDQTNTLKENVELWKGQLITNIFKFKEPTYTPFTDTLTTISTQSDFNNEYIVRDFNNILGVNITGIWRTVLDKRILVNVPSSFPTLTSTYCWAGVSPDNMENAYYMQFGCKVSGARQITVILNPNYEWQTAFSSLMIVVFFEGFMSLTNPTGTTTSGSVASYASITSNWQIDNTPWTFYISPTPTPILRNLEFNQESFSQTLAQIGNNVLFYGAIWPYTLQSVNQITEVTFQIANDYYYPPVQTLSCKVQRVFEYNVECTLNREYGRTLVTLVLPGSPYDHGPFLFWITNSNPALLFQAPDYEGSFLFNLTFSNSSNGMVEQGNSWMTIEGPDVNTFATNPILADPSLITLWQVSFQTVERLTPQGYYNPSQFSYTNIELFFQTSSPAFPVDLGSGLQNMSTIPCLPVQGITSSQKYYQSQLLANAEGSLTCILIIGTPTINTIVSISGYDPIPAYSNVEIYLEGIATLAVGATSRVNMEIMSHHTGDPNVYIFYNSIAWTPDLTPTAYAGSGPGTLTIGRTGSTQLKSTSTYTFTLSSPALTGNRDWIAISFPNHGYELNVDYTSVTVTISSPSTACKSYIFRTKNIIYVYPTANVASGSVTVTMANMPSPDYNFPNPPYSYTASAIVNTKTANTYSASYSLVTTLCTLFTGASITYTSPFILVNGNNYTWTFTVNHDIEPYGSLAVIFDANYYNLHPSSPTCALLSGFPSSATCTPEIYSQQLIRIRMNGTPLLSGTQVSLVVINVNNPITVSTPSMQIESFYDDAQGTTNVICSISVTLPQFQSASIVQCPVSVMPSSPNANTYSSFLVSVNCASQLRNNTELVITFPGNVQGFSSDFYCTTNGNYMLNPCINIAHSNEISLTVTKPAVQQPLEIMIKKVLMPPNAGTSGPISVNIYQYGVLFAQSENLNNEASFNVESNINQVTLSANMLQVNVFPKNFAEVATYFFRIPGLSFKIQPNALLVKFDPTAFPIDVGQGLQCGTFNLNQEYGTNFVMNYEDPNNNVELFSCSSYDDYTILVNYAAVISTPVNTNMEFFFFVAGVSNPPQSTQTSFNFELSFINNNNFMVLISSATATLNFELPPAALEITSLTSNDSNILAYATYNFEFTASTHLPATPSQQKRIYELALVLPPKGYPRFTSGHSQIVYSLNPSYLNTTSAAFNFRNTIFFYSIYPDLSTLSSVGITLQNITNPSTNSECGASENVNSTTFQLQYVSRPLGYVYARTYPNLDQSNCLTLNNSRNAINVQASSQMLKGLAYSLTITIAQPAYYLNLIPTSTYLLFSPSSYTFSGFQGTTGIITVTVPDNITNGEYPIVWHKSESSPTGLLQFLEVPDTIVNVVGNSVLLPHPQITVENFKYVWTGPNPRSVSVTLDQDPATGLTITINTTSVDPNIQGSVDGVTYTRFPISLSFFMGQNSKQFYIKASLSAMDNILTYSVSGPDVADYDTNIPNSPYVVKSETQSSFEILTYSTSSIKENSANFEMTISNLGTIYYLAYVATPYYTPSTSDIIIGKAGNMESSLYVGGSLSIQTLGISEVTYDGIINIEGLMSQTVYSVYFVAVSVFGQYSQTISLQITTSKVSAGVNVHVPVTSLLSNASQLTGTIASILSISPSRVIIRDVVNMTVSASTQAESNAVSAYNIIIAPSPTNNTPTPTTLGQSLLTSANLATLSQFVPQFYTHDGLRITPVLAAQPTIMYGASILSIGYYSVNVEITLIESGYFFAIVAPQGTAQPTSWQINNELYANNTLVPSRYYTAVSTDFDGTGFVIFNELKEYTEYEMYITASNSIPYKPAQLLPNSQVMTVTFRTLMNPNVGNTEESLDIYAEYYGRAGQIVISWILILILLLTIFVSIQT